MFTVRQCEILIVIEHLLNECPHVHLLGDVVWFDDIHVEVKVIHGVGCWVYFLASRIFMVFGNPFVAFFVEDVLQLGGFQGFVEMDGQSLLVPGEVENGAIIVVLYEANLQGESYWEYQGINHIQ